MSGELVSALRELVREVVREELARALAESRPEPDAYLSTADVARLASVAEGTVRRWVREGRLTGHRAGRVLRVRRRDLERMLATVSPRARQLTPEELAERDFG